MLADEDEATAGSNTRHTTNSKRLYKVPKVAQIGCDDGTVKVKSIVTLAVFVVVVTDMCYDLTAGCLGTSNNTRSHYARSSLGE